MKKLITMMVVLAMLLTMSTTIFASEIAPDAVVTGGSLAITALAIGDFTGVPLDGATQMTTAAVTAMELTDSRGLGFGWNVSLKATAFTLDTISLGLAAAGAVGTLPLSSLDLGLVSIAVSENGAGSTATTNITIAQGKIDTVAGINILSAPLNEGMGTYTVSMAPMTLTLYPASTYAGTYTSTVTLTLSTGPVA